MATLTIQLPNQPPVAHVLKDETVTIGRMKGNTIVVEDESISLSHAKITRKNEEFYLKDLNSTNGTVVNGQPVNEVKLRDRDRVSFGSISGQFEAEVTATAPAPAPALVAAMPAAAPAPPTRAPTTAPVPALNIKRTPNQPSAPAQPTTRKSNSSAGRAPSSRGRLATLAPVLGAVAGLAVVTFLGWRFLRVGQEEKIAAREPDRTFQADAKQPAKAVKAARMAMKGAGPSTGALAAANTPGSTKSSLAALVKALQNSNPAERKQAALSLHSLGPEVSEAAPALREALKDPEPEVRMWSALTLVNNKLYDKETIPIFIRVLQDDNPVLRQLSCLSLGLMPYEDSEKAAVMAALTETADKDLDNDVRNAAVSALNVLDPEAFAKSSLK